MLIFFFPNHRRQIQFVFPLYSSQSKNHTAKIHSAEMRESPPNLPLSKARLGDVLLSRLHTRKHLQLSIPKVPELWSHADPSLVFGWVFTVLPPVPLLGISSQGAVPNLFLKLDAPKQATAISVS